MKLNPLSGFLKKRNGREKLLIFMLLSVVAFFWLSNCVQQALELSEDWQSVAQKNEQQCRGMEIR